MIITLLMYASPIISITFLGLGVLRLLEAPREMDPVRTRCFAVIWLGIGVLFSVMALAMFSTAA